jgi:hypothetical protein
VFLLLAAHQGEELVIALPLAMLGAAYFILKWAASGEEQPEDQDDVSAPPGPTVEKIGVGWRGPPRPSGGEAGEAG